MTYRGNRQREGILTARCPDRTPAPILYGWYISGRTTDTGEQVYGLNRYDNLAILYRSESEGQTGWTIETTASDRAWFYPDRVPGCPRLNHLGGITQDAIAILAGEGAA